MNGSRIVLSHTFLIPVAVEKAATVRYYIIMKVQDLVIVKCPKCGGEIVKGFGKNHSMFYSCEKYPECDFSSWDLPTADKCPKCGGMLFVKKGKGYKYCGNKDCGYSEAPEKAEK